MLYICIQSGIFSRFDERVTAFAAEITKPSTLDVLNDCRGLTVVNCVANVKHFSAGNDIELVNIESVRHLITFCPPRPPPPTLRGAPGVCATVSH